MIKIRNTRVYNIARAIYGARNAMNSWAKSDSDLDKDILGENDLALAKRLVKAGSDHRTFMRQIFVSVDLTAPLYWGKEADTYKVGTVANSCSTMHKIHSKEFTRDDFSHENLTLYGASILNEVIDALNYFRYQYNKFNNKVDWENMIQLLPSSYNQMRTLTLNYEVLRNIYHARKSHKLQEWHALCDWIESLPYSELITE
jgi:hypothetical protein